VRDHYWQGSFGFLSGMLAAGLPYLDRLERTAQVAGVVFGALCAILTFAQMARSFVRKWRKGED